MSTPKIQSARSLPKVDAVSWASAVKPAGTLTQPDPEGTTYLRGGAAVKDGGVDINGFARRDLELRYRDLAVAAAIELVARRSATVFGTAYEFAKSPRISIEARKTTALSEAVSKTVTLPAIDTGIATSIGAYPIEAGSISIRVYRQGLLVSESTDNSDYRIVSQGLAGDPDSVTPKGSILGGTVNYAEGWVDLYVKPDSSSDLQILIEAKKAAALGPFTVKAGASSVSTTLSHLPVVRNTVAILIGGISVVDDGKGRLVGPSLDWEGWIDYSTGSTSVTFPASEADRAWSVEYGQFTALDVTSSDLSSTQESQALGGITGVRYVDNSSYPQDALVSDQDLYRRDLVLYQVLSEADRIFVALSNGTFSETVVQSALDGSITAGAAIGDNWSWALGTKIENIPGYGERWSRECYTKSDQYLAWRDNVLARYVAELSYLLSVHVGGSAELDAFVSETGELFIAENASTPVDPIPSGSPFIPNPVVIATGTASKSGTEVTVLTGFDAAGTVFVGDYVYIQNGPTLESDRVISLTPGGFNVFKSSTIVSGAITIKRDTTVIIPTEYAFFPEQPIWIIAYNGSLPVLNDAKKILVRVKDLQVQNHVENESDQVVFAAVGGHGLATDESEDVGQMVAGWNPEALLVLGSSNCYDGDPDTIEDNNLPYASLVEEGKVFPTIGEFDYAPDHETGTDISAHIDYFRPPGWNTPNNLDGNNGRYYSTVIGNGLVEIFCLNTGWNGESKKDALSRRDPTDIATLEPGGLEIGSRQRVWLEKAIRNSTATWKIVFTGAPPYASGNASSEGSSGGYPPLRFNFKDWGADLVLAGGISAYERLVVDGLTYLVHGSGGVPIDDFTGPSAPGSKIRDGNRYSAIRLTASSKWLRAEVLTPNGDSVATALDTITIWRKNWNGDYTKKDLQIGQAYRNSIDSSTIETVLRYDDHEYSVNGNRYLATIPSQECDLYTLAEEDSRYKTFVQTPRLPCGAGSIVYDKWMKTIRWKPQQIQEFMAHHAAGPAFIGCRSSQQIEIIAANQSNLDSAFWRQKASLVQSGEVHERTCDYRNLDQSAFDEAYEGTVTVADKPVVFTGQARIQDLGYSVKSPLRAQGSQWYRLCFLVEAAKTWARHGNTFNVSSTVGLVGQSTAGAVVPAASSTNVYQQSTNSPSVAWDVKLPPGTYQVQFEWTSSIASSRNVTIRWNGQVLSTSNWSNSSSTAQYSVPVSIAVTQLVAGVLSATVNSPSSAPEFTISKIVFTRLDPKTSSSYRLKASFFDLASGIYPEIPDQRFSFIGNQGSPTVVCTGWIGVDLVGERASLNYELSMESTVEIPLKIRAVHLQTRLAIEPTQDRELFVRYKETCLSQAATALRQKYARLAADSDFRTLDGTAYIWTSKATEKWLNKIGTVEPRLGNAFREAKPGDVGKPALVPSGVFWSGNKAVAGLKSAEPSLQPWQPWMIDYGFLVAEDEFTSYDAPPKNLKLTLIDPTGEDTPPYDIYAPKTNFSDAENSAYLVLL